MYKHILQLFLLAAATLIASPADAAQLVELKPARATDQVAQALVSADRLATPLRAAADIEHQPISVSRPLAADSKLASQPEPFVAQSREFWTTVEASELQSGMHLVTTAPGAVVRISPIGNARELALDDIQVRSAAFGKQSLTRASDASAASDALRASGMAVADGALAFRLAPKLGSGRIALSAETADGRYLVHVLDTHSALVLSLDASRATVLDGASLGLHLALADHGKSRRAAFATGMVTAPDGSTFPVDFDRRQDGSFHARFAPDASHSIGPTLWQAHAFVAVRQGREMVMRDVRTAFAVSAPTARLAGDVRIKQGDNGLVLAIGIQAARASRYQVSAVLYGSDADGSMKPAALAQSAAWREAGSSTLSLRFDADRMASGGLHAPWQLHDLRLFDQASMQLLERRSQALALP